MSNLFSKSALDNLSTPEQLDQQTKIVKPYYWLGIFAFAVLILAIVIWSFFGNINSTISMQGIVFPKSGVSKVVAGSEGTVQDVLYQIDDEVQKGDIIAIIPDEELLADIGEIQAQLEEDISNREKEELSEQLKELYAVYEQHSVIRASEDGSIQNIISVGQAIQAGDEIANILVNSQYSNNRQVVAYVPLKVAKRLEVGMEAQICPSYVSREEYGYMKGYISSIGTVPVTEDRLARYYGNKEYVADILPSESSVEIMISVQVDEESENLFAWSNKKGNSLNVEVGTVCDIQTVIENNRPISLLY